jgi:hypothetical protein
MSPRDTTRSLVIAVTVLAAAGIASAQTLPDGTGKAELQRSAACATIPSDPPLFA